MGADIGAAIRIAAEDPSELGAGLLIQSSRRSISTVEELLGLGAGSRSRLVLPSAASPKTPRARFTGEQFMPTRTSVSNSGSGPARFTGEQFMPTRTAV